MSKILIIDDEVLLARSVSALLGRAGYQVVTAGDGRTGVEVFDREKPDLVITDIIMPVQEGIETIQVLRERSSTVPIIAISGGGRTNNMDFLRMAKKLGATATLAKPFAKEQLLSLVKNAIGGTLPQEAS